MPNPYVERVLKVEASSFVTLEDGFKYWFPSKGGGMSATDLRIIADELDRLNAPVLAALDAYFAGEQSA